MFISEINTLIPSEENGNQREWSTFIQNKNNQDFHALFNLLGIIGGRFSTRCIQAFLTADWLMCSLPSKFSWNGEKKQETVSEKAGELLAFSCFQHQGSVQDTGPPRLTMDTYLGHTEGWKRWEKVSSELKKNKSKQNKFMFWICSVWSFMFILFFFFFNNDVALLNNCCISGSLPFHSKNRK